MRTNSDGYGQIEDRFFQRIKQNLHIIICLRHNKDLNNNLHKFPMFVHKVACIDVYKEWTENILSAVAYNSLKNNSPALLQSLGNTELNRKDYLKMISRIMAKMHVVTRDYISITLGEKAIEMYSPRKFNEFVHLFLNISHQRVQSIQVNMINIVLLSSLINRVQETCTYIIKFIC